MKEVLKWDTTCIAMFLAPHSCWINFSNVLTLTGSYIHTCHTTFYQKKTKHIQII